MTTIRITDVIDGSKISTLQKRVIVICFLLGIADGFNALSIGYAIPSLSSTYGVGAAQFSVVIIVELIAEIFAGFVIAPLADRFGRRTLIRVGILLFGLATIPIYFATSIEALAFWRFVAGVGIGTAVPNGFALGSEYSPSRMKATTVTILSIGNASGGMLIGLVGAWVIPHYGGSTLMLLSGVAPLIIALTTWRFLPESVEFLARKGDFKKVASIVAQIDPSHIFRSDVAVAAPDEVPVGKARLLFSDGRAMKTIVIWMMFFCALFNSYYVFSWLSTLLVKGGIAESSALLATSLATFGGMAGGFILGFLMDRTRIGVGMVVIGPIVAIAAALLLVWNLSGAANATGAIILCVLLGFGTLGASSAIQVIGTQAYPTAIRATGFGWATGFSKIGGLVAPALGGAMLAANYSPQAMLLVTIVPVTLVAVFAVVYAVVYGNVSGGDPADAKLAAPTAGRDSSEPALIGDPS